MMNLVSDIEAITKIQNIQKNQFNNTTDNLDSKRKTSDKNTDLKDYISNKDSNKVSNSNPQSNFNRVLDKVKSNNFKNDMAKNVKSSVKEIKINTKKGNDTKLDEIEKEIDEKIENLTDEQLVQCLSLIADFLNNILSDNQNLNFDVQNIEDTQFDELTKSLSDSLMQVLNSNNVFDISNNETHQKANDVFNELLNILDKADGSENIDLDVLKLVQKLTNQINENLDNSVNEGAEDKNSALTELINLTENKINEMLNSNTKNNNELTLQNNSLNSMYMSISDDKNSDSKYNSNSQNSQSGQSKDQKVLESILNDKNSNNTVPVFTTNTIVNNAAGIVIEAKHVVNAGSIAADIIQDVKYMASNDMREMVVKVNPANLGEITIKLVEEDGIMKLHMKAASKETYSLLVRESSEIKNQLNNQNIKIQDVNISLYEEDTTFFKDGEFSRSFDEQKGSKRNGKTNTTQGSLEDDNAESDNYDSSAVNMLV